MTQIDKDGDEIVNSYRLLLVAHNSSGFDSWVVQNSLVREKTDLKNMKNRYGIDRNNSGVVLKKVIHVK